MNTFTPEDRGNAFTGGTAPSESLSYQQHRMNSAVPRSYKANGMNQQTTFSGVGSSARDLARLTVGATPISGSLPSGNGSSARTNEARRPFQSTLVGAQY